MAKRQTKRLENGYKNATHLPKKRSYEHYRLEYAGLDKTRKKTLFNVSIILFITATLLLCSIRLFV